VQVAETQLLKEPDRKDPLGFGLKSIAEPLQRYWLIRAGNPNFETEVRGTRTQFAIPQSGFTNAEDYVDWIVGKLERHGHRGNESLTRFHHRNTSWPIHDSDLPGPCCPEDPLFSMADSIAVRFEIDSVGVEPGFGDLTIAIVEYMLLNRWSEVRAPDPDHRPFRGVVVQTYPDRRTIREMEQYQKIGLDADRGIGAKLPLWFQWWKLSEEGKTPNEIAGIAVETSKGSKFYEVKTISNGIAKVKKMMAPSEILNDS